jgi:hypothetical protein
MVGVVRGSEADFGGFIVELECRNRAARDAQAEVLSPGEDVRKIRLAALEEWDDAAGAWTPVDIMARSMGRYRFRSPVPLSKRDVVCVEAAQ